MPHTELWHQLFAEEKARLLEGVATYPLAIEHVGSTAVCGLSAKPIIDIAISVRQISDSERCVIPLEGIGYKYRGEQGIPCRDFFAKGELRTHHLHIVEAASDFWRNHLLLGDYLRQHSFLRIRLETIAVKARSYRGIYEIRHAAYAVISNASIASWRLTLRGNARNTSSIRSVHSLICSIASASATRASLSTMSSLIKEPLDSPSFK